MPTPDLIFKNAGFFENLQEHRFLHDLSKALILRNPPVFLNILKSEVDMFGIDFVLSAGDRTCHVQMKTRSGSPSYKAYDVSKTIWSMPNSCVIWMLYSQSNLEPESYYLFGFPLPTIDSFLVNPKRPEYRKVKTKAANHKQLSIGALAEILFPRETNIPSEPR